MFQIDIAGVLKWLFGLSRMHCGEYEKYRMSPQTRLKISGFVHFPSKIKLHSASNKFWVAE
jgi:hypothetical protein